MRYVNEARTMLLKGGVLLAALFLFVGGTRPALAATDISNGALVKGTPSAVYFVNAEGKRMAFPNEATYFSWYNDFSTVKTVSDEEIAALPLSGLVTLKPGLSPVKVVSDDKVYAIAHGGVLRELKSPEIVAMIFGSDWEKNIVSIPSAFYSSYTSGEAVTGGGQYWWKQEKEKSPDISADRGLSSIEVPVKPKEAAEESTESDSASKYIVDVEVFKYDYGTGTNGEDGRGFRLKFAKTPSFSSITVTKKNDGMLIGTEESNPSEAYGEDEIYTPDNWKNKLEPNTTYAWKAKAAFDSGSSKTEDVERLGEFTTADFNNGAIATDSSGRFAINSVVVKKSDAKDKPAEDVRTFSIAFSDKPHDGYIFIFANDNYASEVVRHPLSLVDLPSKNMDVTPFNIYTSGEGVKLKPDTKYTWFITAVHDKPADDATIIDTMTQSNSANYYGQFKTGSF